MLGGMFTVAGTRTATYSWREVCELAGCTYRQLDYWVRNGLVRSSLQEAHGSGSQRIFSAGDVARARYLAVWSTIFLRGDGIQDSFGLIRRLGPEGAALELRRIASALEALLPEID